MSVKLIRKLIVLATIYFLQTLNKVRLFLMSVQSTRRLLSVYQALKADYASLFQASAAAAEADRTEDAAYEDTISTLQLAVAAANQAIANRAEEDKEIEALIQAELDPAPESSSEPAAPTEESGEPVVEAEESAEPTAA